MRNFLKTFQKITQNTLSNKGSNREAIIGKVTLESNTPEKNSRVHLSITEEISMTESVQGKSNDQIIRIMEQLKEEIKRELPAQKSYLKTQEKLKNQLNSLNLLQSDYKLALDKLDLQLNRFSSNIDTSTENQTDLFNDLIESVDRGFSDFQSHLTKFTETLKTNQIKDIQKIEENFLQVIQRDIQKIQVSLLPLQEIVKKDNFEKLMMKASEERRDFLQKLHNKIELTTAELLSGQKSLPTIEWIQSKQDDQTTYIHNIIKNLDDKFVTKIIPQQLHLLENNLLSSIQSNTSLLEEKIDKSPVPQLVSQLKQEIQKEITQKIALIQTSIEKSPVPGMLKDLQDNIVQKILIQIQNVQKTYQDQNIPEKIKNLYSDLVKAIQVYFGETKNQLQIIEKAIHKPEFIKDLISELNKNQIQELQNVQSKLINTINNGFNGTANQKSIDALTQNVNSIKAQVSQLGTEKSLDAIKKEIQNANPSMQLKDMAKNLDKFEKNTPNLQDLQKISKVIDQIQKSIDLTSKENTLDQINRTILKQNPIPAIQNLIPEISKLLGKVLNEEDGKNFLKKLEETLQTVKTIPTTKEWDPIKQQTMVTLPQLIHQQTKELQQENKSITNLSLTNKDFLQKLEQLGLQIRGLTQERAKDQDLKEFRLLFENQFPTLKTEILNEVGKLGKDQVNNLQNLQTISTTLKEVEKTTQKVPEFITFVNNELNKRIITGFQDFSQYENSSTEKLIKIVENLKFLTDKTAQESTVQEIRKYNTEEWYKQFLAKIGTTIIPAVENLVSPLASSNSIGNLQKSTVEYYQGLNSGLQRSEKALESALNLLKEYRSMINKLVTQEEFNSLQSQINVALNEHMPRIIEENLIVSAKEASLEKFAGDTRADLKEIFQSLALLQDIGKNSNTNLQDLLQINGKFVESTNNTLKTINESVSEAAWNRQLEQIRASVNRLAREESLLGFKSFFERQNNSLTESNEDLRQKVLINQTKLKTIQEQTEKTVTTEDMINLGEFMIDHIKKPLQSEIVPILNTLSKEETIQKQREEITEMVSNLVTQEELRELKSEQENMNKFLFKMLKITEQIHEDHAFIEESFNSISEKITLLFEFVKRVSGI